MVSSKYILLGLLIAFQQCVVAQFWDITEPKLLKGSVNSTAEESMPVFSEDSSVLYFTRTLDKSNKFGVSDQNVWRAVRGIQESYDQCELVSSFNNKFNNAVVGISKDGSAMYLLNSYEGKKDLIKGLSVARKNGDSWGKPVEVPIPELDIDGDFYSFHVASDESVILISYKGPATLGEEDLYVSLKNGDSWTKPMHMGNQINTKGFEISPFLNATKDTLYFSSNGHNGYGDADIYFSVKQNSWSNWSTPKNLGNKINSNKFDAYFSISGIDLYWSSNRDNVNSDIFHSKVLYPPPVSIACVGLDVSYFEGNDGRVNATVDGGVPPYSYVWSNNQLTEDINEVKMGTYTVTVTDAIGQQATCTSTINQPPAPENISFKHFFDYDSDKLSTTSGPLSEFLIQVEDLLKKGRKNIIININSSASYVPTSKFKTNDLLAKSRAESMKKELTNYFKIKGIGNSVTIVIQSAIVQGPTYVKDFANKDKYLPYQFIELKTN
jgi:hypothetical protein